MLKRAAQSIRNSVSCRATSVKLSLNTRFDYVILSDLINDLWDVQTTIERVASVCTPATRVIINTYSRMWELPLRMAGRMGLRQSDPEPELADARGCRQHARARRF